jgi:predicted N-acetyltransferase YhbS
MLHHADLLVTAWQGHLLIGVARSVTDFHYCCYLSDLAVDRSVQHAGIGRVLIRKTREQLGPNCALILLAAPAAAGYYPRLGFTQHDSAWVLYPHDTLA